jgi:hypothetical protein
MWRAGRYAFVKRGFTGCASVPEWAGCGQDYVSPDGARRQRQSRESERRAYFWQDVRSFSSIEKISPASILMLRTRQVRPVVSLRLAS